jgi:hypothetical protein
VLARGYDRCFDVWTLGVLLYEISLGFTPFASTATRQRQGRAEEAESANGREDGSTGGDDPVVALCKRIVKCKVKFPRPWQQAKKQAQGEEAQGAGVREAEVGGLSECADDECADARDLMAISRALLVADPPHRLGCMRGGWVEVKVHRWFGPKIDFDAILLRQQTSTATPPWVPALRDCDPAGPLPLFMDWGDAT